MATMDEGKQALNETEKTQMNKKAAIEAAEAQTGTVAMARTTATSDPTELDPRWMTDDVRIRFEE